MVVVDRIGELLVFCLGVVVLAAKNIAAKTFVSIYALFIWSCSGFFVLVFS